MATTRSPRYPNVSLPEAIVKARGIYEKEHMSPLTPTVAAEAMGYGGIHGASLKMISSLKKYGLLEGRGEDVRLTRDAQVLIIDDPTSADYRETYRRCVFNSEIYAEIRKQFHEGGSERNIAVYLEKQGFKPEAAATVARNYKESIALISSGGETPSPGEESEKAGTRIDMSGQDAKPSSGGVTTGALLEPGGPPFRIVQLGAHLEIVASVDLKGLRKLKRALDTYETLLEMLTEEEAEPTPSV